jgi:hypothetical protein
MFWLILEKKNQTKYTGPQVYCVKITQHIGQMQNKIS